MACNADRKDFSMPKFIVAILNFIGNFYYNHFTSHKETRQDRKLREAREERARARAEKAELAAQRELAERQARREAFELRKVEWHMLVKAMEHFYTMKGTLPILPMKLSHFYRVEVIPFGTFSKRRSFVYAYVECKDCKGATVLLYNPDSENAYSAVYVFDNLFTKIDKPGKDTKVSVLTRAERIFKPLCEELNLSA